jgi:hypothetical protein
MTQKCDLCNNIFRKTGYICSVCSNKSHHPSLKKQVQDRRGLREGQYSGAHWIRNNDYTSAEIYSEESKEMSSLYLGQDVFCLFEPNLTKRYETAPSEILGQLEKCKPCQILGL